MKTRVCTKCKKTLPAMDEYFSRRRKSKDGLNWWCKECYKSYLVKYRKQNSDRLKRYQNERNQELKFLVLSHYGGCCAVCGITDSTFLTIDHIDGGGSKHRNEIGKGKSYAWLRNSGFPPGFQVLCWNHNFLKHLISIKSKRKRSNTNLNNIKSQDKIKRLIMDHYGGKCDCCGITDIGLLTIDHINNDGNIHRKESGCGNKIYRWLIKNKFPLGFHVLCWNCNCGRRVNGGVCPHQV